MRIAEFISLILLLLIGNAESKKNGSYFSPTILERVTSISDSRNEVIVYIGDSYKDLPQEFQQIGRAIDNFMELNPDAGNSMSVIPFIMRGYAKRIIFANVGNLSSDTANSRTIHDTTAKAMHKVVELGYKSVTLVVGPMKTALPSFKWAHGDYPMMTAVLGAMHALYVPLQVREEQPDKAVKVDSVALFMPSPKMIKFLSAVKEASYVMRDIGDTNPERTSPPKIVEYLQDLLPDWNDAGITMEVDDVIENKAKYPMAYAVNRATLTQPQHHGKIVKVVYTPSDTAISQTLIFVGKGVALDTGGADIKVNGGMYGMHNDKLGAAFVAGFFHALSILKPANLKVIGYMPFIRNSIGKNAYLTDEVVTLTNGLRVRIGNTDAEGRNILTDVLALATNDAKTAINPHIFTVATLTGAAKKAYGPYTVSMDNGPAEDVQMAYKLMASGDLIGDPTEVARIRYEDFKPNMPISEWENVEQFNTNPGATGQRGFTFPMGYFQMVSKLNEHGRGSALPIKYTHCDIAGSGGGINELATDAPIRMFSIEFLWPQITVDE